MQKFLQLPVIRRFLLHECESRGYYRPSEKVYARLMELYEKWTMFTQVNPLKTGFVIPQVIVGPGGVFTTDPSISPPDRRYFKDHGPLLFKTVRS